MEKTKTKKVVKAEDDWDDVPFELFGQIQLLHDYTLMHLRQRNCVQSPAVYSMANELAPFDELKSLKRLKRSAQKFLVALEDYKKTII